jgi:3-hydroxyacyl-CoA dehydrogenase
MAFERVVVIGSGVMGVGIAAHCANAGCSVVLLDIVPDGADDRNQLAKAAVQQMLKSDPEMLMLPEYAERIEVGNLEDDLERIAQADWIVEVVLERLDIKHSVFEKIEAHRRPGSLVTSNTSTIPRAKLMQGMPDSLAREFIITHFFNPPRYLPLLEIVSGDEVDPELLESFCEFAEIGLGKRVIVCNDTPGFIGNRIAMFFGQSAINATVDLELTVEQTDAMLSRPIGVPKTGVFGLFDLVGVDLIPHILDSMLGELPEDDGLCQMVAHREMLDEMIADGWVGRKGKGGFYRLNTEDGGRVKEARNLQTGEYAPADRKAAFPSARLGKLGIRQVMEHGDTGSQLVRRVVVDTLAYVCGLVPEVTDSIDDIDSAMRVGFMWKRGPFEMIDDIGADWLVAALEADGKPVPELLALAAASGFYKVEGGELLALTLAGEHEVCERPLETLTVADLKRRGKPLKKNGSASLWDMGDDVLLVEYHSKMNAMDPLSMEMLLSAVEEAESGDWKGIVIGNDGQHFCAGANLGLALFAANLGAWKEIEQFIQLGQDAYMALKHCNVPVVSASTGMCVGGGCEVLLHSDAVQAHAESYIGLVEVGVGIIPAWGGCKEMLGRFAANGHAPKGPMGPVMTAFELIGLAKVAKSAHQAQEFGFLEENTRITMNRSRLLNDAKQLCLELSVDYTPPEPFTYRLPGVSGRAALEMAVRDLALSGKATPHDVVVVGELATVLTGGETDHLAELDEEDLLELERAAILHLSHDPASLDRMQHMLEKGKPLRN